MAVLYITEYSSMEIVEGGGGVAQIAKEPASGGSKTYAITASSTQSAAFAAGTQFIEVHTDAIVAIEIGANPTALVANTGANTGSKRMPADSTRYYGVTPGHKLAMIATT